MIEIISPLIKQFLPFAQKRMGFDAPPKLFLRGDDKNAKNPLGKTAYYDPGGKSITVYITGRHPKDVMRSISHELVHHAQCCRGDFDGSHNTDAGYAQNDKHMREMEREAYEKGNMCFRDWEDSLKNTIYLEHLQKGENKMSTKDWKNKELTQLLSEAWGFKFNTLDEFNEFNGEGELQAEAEEELEENKEEELEEVTGRDDPVRQQSRGSDRVTKDRKRPMEEADEVVEEEEIDEVKIAKKGKPDDGKDKEDSDVDAKKKPTKEQIEALVKKALQEALQKRKG